MKKIKEYLIELKNVNESKVQNASDFKRRLQAGKWEYDKKEFEELKQFVKDMDNKYRNDEHSWGKYSESAIKYPKFYKRINESLHKIETLDEFMKIDVIENAQVVIS